MLCSGPAVASAAATPLWYSIPSVRKYSVHASMASILVNLGSAAYWLGDHSFYIPALHLLHLHLQMLASIVHPIPAKKKSFALKIFVMTTRYAPKKIRHPVICLSAILHFFQNYL